MTFVTANPWTKSEDRVLRTLYTKVSITEIARRLNRTDDGVAYRIRIFQRKGLMRYETKFRRKWTRREDLYIIDRYPYDRVQEIATALRRTYRTVVTRAGIIGAGKNLSGIMTQKEVSAIMGVHKRHIRAWIEDKRLIGEHKGRQYISVDRASLEDFVRAYPWEYDAERTDPDSYIGIIARQTAAEHVYYTVQEAAAAKFVGATSIRNAIWKKELAHVRTATGAIRISKTDLDAWTVNF